MPVRSRHNLDANIPHLMANAMEEIYETEATKELVDRMPVPFRACFHQQDKTSFCFKNKKQQQAAAARVSSQLPSNRG